MSHYGCHRHSLHYALFHKEHKWVALSFWFLLLPGIPAGLAAGLWSPLGPVVYFAGLLAEVVWLLSLRRHAT